MTCGEQELCVNANDKTKETSDQAKGIQRVLQEMKNKKGLLTMRLWEGMKLAES